MGFNNDIIPPEKLGYPHNSHKRRRALLVAWVCLCSVIFLAFSILSIIGTVKTLRSTVSAEAVVFNILGIVCMAFPYASFMVLAIKKLKRGTPPKEEVKP